MAVVIKPCNINNKNERPPIIKTETVKLQDMHQENLTGTQ